VADETPSGGLWLRPREPAAGIRERFARVRARQKHADDSMAAGREYVKAYVEFIHYVEQLHLVITGAAAEKEQTTPASAQ
jgi:hypothetical protein